MWFWITFGFGLSTMLFGLLMWARELRSWPVCPDHQTRMELVGDTAEFEEFACATPGCMQCADKHLDGTVRYFNA